MKLRHWEAFHIDTGSIEEDEELLDKRLDDCLKEHSKIEKAQRNS